jgi:hypothetical protein
MPFAPVIDPTSAEFIFRGLNNQTAARNANLQHQREIVDQSVNSLADTAGKYFQQAAQNHDESQMLDAKMAMFATAKGPTGNPIVDPATLQKYTQASLPAKRAIAGLSETMFAKAMKDMPPNVSQIPGTDYVSVNGSVVPTHKPQQRLAPKTVRQLANGALIAVDPNNPSAAQPVTVNGQQAMGPVKSGDPFASANSEEDQARAQQLQQEIAALHADMQSKGPGAKAGWGMPWDPTIGAALAQKQAELAQIAGNGGSAPAMGGQSQPAMMPTPQPAVKPAPGVTPAPGAMPGQVPAAAVSPAASPAANGYVVGRAYRMPGGGTSVYLGGDVSNPASWR